MAPIQSMDDDREPRRRTKAIRYAVPVAAAGVAAATIGLVPALANAGSPDLPKITAEELIAKVAASDTQTLSGSVRITTDFGLPALLTGATGGGGPFGGGGGGGGGGSADPQEQLTRLLAGSHTLRVAADGPQRQKVSIVERAAEYSLIHKGDEVWAYDSGSNRAYHLTGLPQEARDKAKGERELPEGWPTTPQQAAEKILDTVDDTSTVSVDGTARIAGRDAYQLVVSPKAADSTIGAIRIGVDADTGVPLKFTLAPKGGGKAIVDVAFTKVDFARPAASTFDFTPPKGAEVTTEKAGEKADEKADEKAVRDGRGLHEEFGGLEGLEGLGVLGKGWDSIAELKLPKDALNAGPSDGGGKAPGFGGRSPLESFGKEVKGDFGTGTVIGTRLVNALITDSGKVYVGTVNQDALIRAANAAAE